MAVLNMTPDSFSGDGMLAVDDPVIAALERAHQFVRDGADILDIGGESTRPGAQPVPAAEEIERVVPVVRALAASGIQAVLSVDTSKAGVAEAALQAGAQWINDVWGLRADPEMAAVIARSDAGVVLMHNRLKSNNAEIQARLGGHYVGVQYTDLLGEVKAELLESVTLAHQAGIPDEHIILDPGIGFGKTVAQSLELLDRLPELCRMGYPLLIGPSRKSFIGYTLDLPPEQRIEGTAAAVAVGITRGADIIRVHDLPAMLRVARMTDAIVRRTPVDKAGAA